jgi:hypothetical protein
MLARKEGAQARARLRSPAQDGLRACNGLWVASACGFVPRLLVENAGGAVVLERERWHIRALSRSDGRARRDARD